VPPREHVGQRQRLLVAVVDPSQHHVLNEHPPALALVECTTGVDHITERKALVDRHQLRPQRFIGGVQRQRQA